MNKDEKNAMVADLHQTFQGSDSAIFVDFRGLKVGEVTELRSLLRKESGRMLVIKNTLAGIAAKGTSFEGIDAHLEGPTAVVFATEVRSSAKILTDFARIHEKLSIKFCALGGRIVEGKEAENLAKLPSREELRSQILGLINQPAAMLLAQINAPGQQLASVLQAWIDKRKEDAPAGGEEIAPAKGGEDAPAGGEEIAPAKGGEDAPAGGEEIAPAKGGEDAPAEG